MIPMVMFSFVDTDHWRKVSFPDREIYLSYVYSDFLKRYFLCVQLHDQKDMYYYCGRASAYGISPSLRNYKALPYKKQSSVIKLDEATSALRCNPYGIPWCLEYKGLEEIKAFCSSLKRQYAIIAHTRLPLNEDREKVLILFDRYSDALPLIADCGYDKIKGLLGEKFKTFNVLHPYLLVDYMGHPICLLSKVSSYTAKYLLASDWCRWFLCFLRGSLCQKDPSSSAFVFMQEKWFRKVIRYDDWL